MKVDAFDFDLPPERIAQHPVQPKDRAKMLVVEDDVMRDDTVANLADFLEPGDIVVFNDTRVIPARMNGRRGEAGIEVTLHKRESLDTWWAFARPAKKLKPEDIIDFGQGLEARVADKIDGGEVQLVFNQTGDQLMAALETVGYMPLPPYIKRPKGGEADDLDDYQTLFAKEPGAVAAPTAGLHFTDNMMNKLKERGVLTANVTLHVGAGTFLPVKVEDTEDHKMHSEYGEVSPATADAVNQARQNGGQVVAIGTTSLRVLESAADDDGQLHPFSDETDIFITPGYRFKIVDKLMTNFHLPKSTLFMLVAAVAGMKRMKWAYRHAIRYRYRFYSYGDACLLSVGEDMA
ncbi:tRNA preQ1(34) S-adenosylmethionine ribosyltransferase-isomerase QueA [Magnetovibrio sp. PR-2]|uniref:tRNA preQ1(34) S-adenosylmethionine ribosyltransferase-isomerase QueA n=1 Tax=Magnetovibrio sp. PR-2 TaxID=3120356 RepID=UPI002FCE402A